MRSLQARAKLGGETLYGRFYRGGQLLPFYVPRDHMPQIDTAAHLGELAEFLSVNDVEFSFNPKRELVDISAHQRVDAARAAGALLGPPVLLSHEPFIVDGNHRTAKARMLHLPTYPALTIQLSFTECLELLQHFPRTEYIHENQAAS